MPGERRSLTANGRARHSWRSTLLQAPHREVEMCTTGHMLRGLPVLLATCMLQGSFARAETLDELYAKAKDEKSLVIYAGGPVSNYEPLAREFERKFPGLTVSIEGGFSNVLNQKIEQQFKDKKLAADMVLFQTAQDFVRWKSEGRMLAFKPEGSEAIDKSFKDPDGAFVVWYVGTLSYAYNTQHVKPDSAPKSALDFLKPEFRGKMIACYPHDDDATLYLFHTIAKKYGWDYVEKYLANQPNWVQGHLGVSRSVAAGTDLVTLDATTSTILNLKKAGQPVEFVFSEVDPIPIYYSTAGIFKDAPHSNVAKLYLTWVLQAEQQRRIGSFSPRSDVQPPVGLKPLFSYNVANGYRDFVTDTSLIADLRKKFETAIGPIRNAGGVR
jgi:ABC-type Fe3+ transport system substrate-binding protein